MPNIPQSDCVRMVACKRARHKVKIHHCGVIFPGHTGAGLRHATTSETHILTSSAIKSSDGKGLGSGDRQQRDMTSYDITVM